MGMTEPRRTWRWLLPAGGLLLIAGAAFAWLLREPCRLVLGRAGEAARAVAFSADGSLLAGGNDRAAHVWALPSGESQAVVESKVGPVLALAFSPDAAL